ncbi:MAG TPA: M67 family metallopeptidase [Thermoanaerobaculia bacterium]|nr:M67 family metallopeptidase [Thermoanaerobaculia bacterium]
MSRQSSTLILSATDRETIERHLEAGYPDEACGVMIGRELDSPLPVGERPEVRAVAATPTRTQVVRLVLADNAREDSRHNRYVIPPEAVLAAEKAARAEGLGVIGYFHSHPDHPARPSEFDREHAWPGLSYLIVSIRHGKAKDVRSWRLSDDRERFLEETLELP